MAKPIYSVIVTDTNVEVLRDSEPYTQHPLSVPSTAWDRCSLTGVPYSDLPAPKRLLIAQLHALTPFEIRDEAGKLLRTIPHETVRHLFLLWKALCAPTSPDWDTLSYADQTLIAKEYDYMIDHTTEAIQKLD